MPEPLPITIVGGGLAGLALGIALRRENVPVKLLEVGEYPRHRVCGEFINGDGKAVLERLELLPELRAAGMRKARQVSFWNTSGEVCRKRLPIEGWCLSRYRLDALLAHRFRELGGTLRCGVRWRGNWLAGTVCATGRRAEIKSGSWRFFGIKAHARGLTVDSDLELHWGPSGYVGVGPVEGDVFNVCGLFRSREPVSALARKGWQHPIVGPEASPLRHLLRHADWDEDSFQAVAAIAFDSGPRRADGVCRIGDAYAMIPPLTGNGMSIAFESAEIASRPLAEYSVGQKSWEEVCIEIHNACRSRFASRLRVARVLQNLLFRPVPRSIVFAFGASVNRCWEWMFSRTR